METVAGMQSNEQTSGGPSLQDSARAQARIRLILGCPVLVLILAALLIDGPPRSVVASGLIAGYAVLYLAYNIGVYRLVERLDRTATSRLIVATAVLDPLLLSGWLSLMGPSAVLFVCFYLFTILGFGFRIGIGPMRVCQAASLAGFIGVVLVSPVWRDQTLVASANVIFLIVVPLYATSLLRGLHQAREQAQHESRSKTQLLANVSHELRTPLAGIVSSAQLIQEDTAELGTSERTRMILDLASELNREIDHLLDAAQHHAGVVRVEPASTILREVLDRVERALLPIASLKGIGFSIRLDPRIETPVLVDARLLVGVLVNLGGNAVKFTEHGRADVCVDLVGRADDGYRVRFSVTDTGIGIPRELQAKIFEPFFQVSSGTRRSFGGTGLGTSIAREIVAKLGGELRLLSEPGKGSEFWFELRLPKADPIESAAEAAIELATVRVRNRRILVVDDNHANLKLIAEMLAKDEHKVTSVDSGVAALQCLSEQTFDLMLLDFNMADIDGGELYRLYCFGVSDPVRTVFVTADTTAQTRKRLLDLGAAAVLHKPVRFDVLRRTLLAVLDPVHAPGTAIESPADAERPMPLRAVPVEYLDAEAIDAIREISDDPSFLSEMIDAGVDDLQRLEPGLIAAIDTMDLSLLRDRAHAVKGVSLNLGAIRLAALADRLMSIDAEELRAARGAWRRDLHGAFAGSIERLRHLQAAA